MRGSTIGCQPLIDAHPVANAESTNIVDKLFFFMFFSKKRAYLNCYKMRNLQNPIKCVELVARTTKKEKIACPK